MIYKDALMKLREEKFLKQYEVAKILGIYKGLYNQYENEYEIIPLKHLNTLCNYFCVSIDYIFGFTTSRQYPDMKIEIDKNKSASRLKEFRKEHKLTQSKLATFLNTTFSNISAYERGIHVLSTNYVYAICKKYHISADYLLGKIDEPKYLK